MGHTPGPWAVRWPEGHELHEVYAEEGGELICFPVFTGNGKANMPLIAAAPDLLAALKAHLPWKEEPAQGWGAWADAVAAIAKAEGTDVEAGPMD